MESLQTRVNEEGRILRTDIQEFFDKYLVDRENPLPEYQVFLSGLTCITKEQKLMLEMDIGSYVI